MSGAIGSFEIGVDAIGTAPFDYSPTILSQYANSPTILDLIERFSGCLDPAADIDNFYDAVLNLDTAQGFGLDIWGRIVDVQRVYPLSEFQYFGFLESTTALGFNQGVFWSGANLGANFALTDPAYRRLIYAKAMSNIIDGSIPAINLLLRTMFPGRGNCFVVDHGGMSMTYQFNFPLTAVDLTLVVNSGVLPHPTGVTVSVAQS